jgi:hypothetical protein
LNNSLKLSSTIDVIQYSVIGVLIIVVVLQGVFK